MLTTQLHRERLAWRRRLRLDCGCSLPCGCDGKAHPSPQRIDGYRSAIEHLAANGCVAAALTPELHALWRRGGTDRSLAENVLVQWQSC